MKEIEAQVSTVRQLLRQALLSLAPGLERKVSVARWNRQHADELRGALAMTADLEERARIAITEKRFYSVQKHSEIVALLRLLAARKPRRLCEIGADRGGT